MARPSKKLEPTKNTQEEIEAAVNAYYATGGNPTPPPNVNVTTDGKLRVPVAGETIKDIEKKLDSEEEKKAIKEYNKGGKCGDGKDPYELQPNAKEVNIEISAVDCFKTSNENTDGTIVKHILGINEMIKKEAIGGGYSVHIRFGVSQGDWVNVQHIVDWYRARGFEILNYDVSTPPYGKESGVMMYNFTISWTNAKV